MIAAPTRSSEKAQTLSMAVRSASGADDMDQVITKQQTSSIRTLQFITIVWMVVELCVALYSGIRAHSIALTAFGADSAIELLSALVVLRRFALGPATEKRTARISGFLLYGLAAYILVTSLLSFLSRSPEAEPTLLGIGLLIAAAVVMPLLGRAKKSLAQKTGSRALNADARPEQHLRVYVVDCPRRAAGESLLPPPLGRSCCRAAAPFRSSSKKQARPARARSVSATSPSRSRAGGSHRSSGSSSLFFYESR